MKNRKISLTLAVVFALVLTVCDNGGGGNKTVVCTCNPKEHYLPCTCEAAGTAKCTCVVIPRGYISEYQTNVQIPIWQKAGVTNAQAIGVTTALTAAWNTSSIVTDSDKNKLKEKVQEVWIVKTATDQTWKRDIDVVDNKAIIKVQYDCPYIDNIFNDLADNLSSHGL
ncbi:MAG: hypothetical protein LBB89_05485 [Treponema sp.]|jgi:hypothetical protein|nr:hypothetical protein [Treponema sp.]